MTGLHKRINSRLDKAIWEYHMLSDGDCILFAVSGGADSMALVKLLHQRIHIYAKSLRLHALYVDLGFDGNQEERCKHMNGYFQSLDIKATTLKTRIGPDAHRESNKVNPCFLCSRIRRKHIFKIAEELSCNKIVFGHHKDDLIQTLILNMIFGREISTMTPKLQVFKGKFTLLRPMAFVDEPMIKHFIEQQNIPVIEQNCPTDGKSEREYIKSIVYQLERKFRGARNNIFYSMKNVKTDYLL
jgi:tRNA 2-thiocytidine biosynthesis protein TtcA